MNNYLISDSDNVLKLDKNGQVERVLNPKIAPFLTLSEILNAVLPDMKYNRYFFRRKIYHAAKELHSTDELEIVDKEQFNSELEKYKDAKIVQYIGDGVIVTEIEYTKLETEVAFLKRVRSEIADSHRYFSASHQHQRFSCSESGLTDAEFTKVILSNMLKVAEAIDIKLKQIE